MMATWMLYSLLAGTLVAGAAWAVEGMSRLAGRPTRWVWAGAMLLVLGLVALAPGRTPPEPRAFALAPMEAAEITAPAAPAAAPLPVLERARRAAEGALRGLLAAGGSRAPRELELYLAALWGGSALALAWAIGSTHWRARRLRRRWPVSELHGTRVRVAPELGPAVVGVARAEIVVPRWFLALPADQSRLVLEHEREHLRARDPLLLTLGWSVAALLAWNPALWWMLSRLRLAVELDCDARVLGRGADRRGYGAVLIELAGRSSRLHPGMLALADPPSQLERRLLAMTAPRARFALPRAALLGATAGTALLAACAAELPTASEIQALDVAAVERAGGEMALLDMGHGTVYSIDGVIVTREQALAVEPAAIATVNVARGSDPSQASRIDIVTRAAAANGPIPELPEEPAAPAEPGEPGEPGIPPAPTESPVRVRVPSATGAQPLFVVDGTPVVAGPDRNPLRDIPPGEVESVEVIKDPTVATARYGERASNGVVVIVTKRAARGGDSSATPQRRPTARDVAAEGRVSGTVVDQAGRPRAGATVRTRNHGVMTDSQGRFVLSNLPAGKHDLEVTAEGRTMKVTVDVPAGATTPPLPPFQL